MTHNTLKISFQKISKHIKEKRLNETKENLRIFCISNFHFKTRFPLLKWIKHYRVQDFPNDLIAGIIIAFIIVVQSLAISMITNVPGEHGIYSSLIGGFVNFLFGTSKDVSLGPSLLVAAIVARYNEEGSYVIASMIAFFNGIFFLIISFVNLGFLMEFISYPVLTGWITAGALSIVIGQLPSWFGLIIKNTAQMSSYEIFYEVLKHISEVNVADLMFGSIAFLICIILYFTGPIVKAALSKRKEKYIKVINKIINMIIIARIGWVIVLVSIVGYTLRNKISRVAALTFLKSAPSGLPRFSNPFQAIKYDGQTLSVTTIIQKIYPSFYLVPFVILIESLAAARNFGKQFGYQVDNNQELMCLGIGNLFNSFITGYSIGGALARTSVHALSGCVSLFSGLITSILLIPVMLFCMPLVGYVSKAVMSACICSAAFTQIQISSLRHIWKIRKIELLPWIATFLCGLYKLEIGMLVGFVVSAAFIMFRELRPRVHGVYNDKDECVNLYVRGAIHFPGAYSFSTRLRTMNKIHPNVKKIIIDFTNMYETDSSVVEELREAILAVEKCHITIVIMHLKRGRVYDLFTNAGLTKFITRGLRSNSCTIEIPLTDHLVPYHLNPRDLLPRNMITSEETQYDKAEDDEENNENYIYTVRSYAEALRTRV